jgi:NitT/TauT family transport system substrate-binding protein
MQSPRAPRTGLGRLVRIAAVTAVLTLAVTACTSQTPEPEESPGAGPAPASLIVTVAFPAGSPGGATMWIGEELGYFEEENLDVEFVNLAGRPAETVGLVVAGQADMVIASVDALVVPLGNGDDLGLKWLFTPYQAPSFAIAVAEDSDIESAADLEGKTVAMSAQGPPFETFMKANVSGDGADPSTVEIVTVGGSAAAEALNRGEIDAIVANRADLVLASKAVGVEIRELPQPENVANSIAAGFMVRADATDEQKDAYARYLRAYLKASIFAQENPEAAVALNWQMFPAGKPADLSEEDALKQASTILKATVDQFRPAEDGTWGLIDEKRWDAYIANLGLSAKIPDASVIYDNSLLDKISDFDADEVSEFAKNYKN